MYWPECNRIFYWVEQVGNSSSGVCLELSLNRQLPCSASTQRRATDQQSEPFAAAVFLALIFLVLEVRHHHQPEKERH